METFVVAVWVSVSVDAHTALPASSIIPGYVGRSGGRFALHLTSGHVVGKQGVLSGVHHRLRC